MIGTSWGARARVLGGIGLSVLLGGCVSVAEFRKLEYEVNKMRGGGGGGAQMADVSADLQAIRDDIARLEGRVEVVEHQTATALREAQTARKDSYAGGAAATPGAAPAGDAVGPDGEPLAPGVSEEEVKAYRDAYAAWRADDLETCVDRFREFLQTFPASDHADDAAFWLADCHYKQGDYKTAILRFDDVVGRYPEGNKAPDALYRQGEALIQLGPSFNKAAEKAFERLINEYPDSPRVGEARRQLELLQTG